MILVGNIYSGLNSGGGPVAVNTNNGISGDGSLGTPVILGGNPLDQNTFINAGTFNLTFQTTDGPTTNGQILIAGGTFGVQSDNFITGVNSQLEIQPDNNFMNCTDGVFSATILNAHTEAQLQIQDAAGTELAEIRVSETANHLFFALFFQEIGPNLRQWISSKFGFNTGGVGISVNDEIDGVGLVKEPSILAATQLANPNAYVTTDCLTGGGAVPAIAASWDVPALTANTLLHTYNLPVGLDQILRVSEYLHTNSAVAGGASVTVSFTNVSGLPSTLVITPVSVAAGDEICNPVTFKALRNTAVTVQSVVLAGGIDYDTGGVLEILLSDS